MKLKICISFNKVLNQRNELTGQSQHDKNTEEVHI